MKNIKVVLVLFFMVFVAEIYAMPTPQRMQQVWKQKQAYDRLPQEKKDQTLLIRQMKQEPDYQIFEQLLQQNEINKNWLWLKGPNEMWQNKVIVAAFELLDSSKFSTSRKNHIKHVICNSMADYNQSCWIPINTNEICNEIMGKLNNLINYVSSGRNIQFIEDTFGNRQLYPTERFENQALYQQLLKERKKQ